VKPQVEKLENQLNRFDADIYLRDPTQEIVKKIDTNENIPLIGEKK